MQGTYFIGLLWGLWIIATFLMNKNNPVRFRLAFLSLLLLITFSTKITIFSINIQVTALLLLIIGYIFVSYLSFRKKVYMMFSIIIMMTGFTGLLLVELYDPVWMFFDRRIVLGGLVFIVAQFLYSKSLYSQLCCAIIGTIQGDFIYTLILRKWEFPYITGSQEFLDICAVYSFLLLSWSFINYLISTYTIKHTLHKQKEQITNK